MVYPPKGPAIRMSLRRMLANTRSAIRHSFACFRIVVISGRWRMTRIYTATTIRCPAVRVFEYVTTPGRWPEWHPSSLAVTGATDHALAPGEQVEETFRVAGRRGRVVWTVREREVPCKWVIEGTILGSRNGGIITYTVTPQGNVTRFEREFVYPVPPLYLLLDRLVLRRRIAAESAEALRRLKQELETN